MTCGQLRLRPIRLPPISNSANSTSAGWPKWNWPKSSILVACTRTALARPRPPANDKWRERALSRNFLGVWCNCPQPEIRRGATHVEEKMNNLGVVHRRQWEYRGTFTPFCEVGSHKNCVGLGSVLHSAGFNVTSVPHNFFPAKRRESQSAPADQAETGRKPSPHCKPTSCSIVATMRSHGLGGFLGLTPP